MPGIQEYFSAQKEPITRFLNKYLTDKKNEMSNINRWGKDVFERLTEYINRGKMSRGALVMLTFESFSSSNETPLSVITTACAMELFQATLLVHDDIMDRDDTRRGMPSIHAQYREEGKAKQIKDPSHFGDSMAICAGDIALFLGYDLLAHPEIPTEARTRLLSKACTEYARVGLAQMEDVYFGHTSKSVTEEEILNVYRYKTAHYTFSLPFALGAILSRQSDETIALLSDIGENLGLIFQIKDDELGLFGDEDVLGKPHGSDILEGKKTLFHYYLLENADEEEKAWLSSWFGNTETSSSDIKRILGTIETSGIRKHIDRRIQEYADKVKTLSKSLPENAQRLANQLLEFSLNRVK